MNRINKITFFLIGSFISSTIVFAQETITKTYDGVENINLSTSSGDGIIKKGSGNRVKVTLEYTYDDDSFEPIFEQSGNRLELKEIFERNSRTSGRSTWTLEIPDDIDVRFNTGSGDLKIDDLKIELRSNLGSGDVELRDLIGDIDVNTGSGDIDVDNLDGELRANTGSGKIEIADSKGDIDVNAGSGYIRLNRITGAFGINVGSGDITASGLNITGSSSFNSGSGDTEVVLVSALDHDISVNSGSGDAVLDFNGNKIEGEILMKASKRNGRIEAPFSFDKEYEEDRGRQVIMIKEAKIGNKAIRIRVSTGSGTARIIK